MRNTLLLGLAMLFVHQEKPPPAPTLPEVYRFTARRVQSARFAEADNKLVMGGDKFVGFIALPDFDKAAQVAWPEDVQEVTLDPDARFMIVRAVSNETTVLALPSLKEMKFSLDVPQGAEVPPRPAGRGPAIINFSGSYAVMANAAKGFRVWQLDDLLAKTKVVKEVGVSMNQYGATLNHVTAVRFMGKTAIIGQEDGFVSFCDYKARFPVKGGGGIDHGKECRRPTTLTVKQACEFRPHGADLASLEVTADNDMLITAGLDGFVKFWKVGPEINDRKPPPTNEAPKPKDPKPAMTLPGTFAVLRPDSGHLAVCEAKGVRIYDSSYNAKTASFIPTEAKLGRPVKAQFSFDGKFLAVIYCGCPACDSNLNPIPGPRKHAYEHGGSIVVFDSKDLK